MQKLVCNHCVMMTIEFLAISSSIIVWGTLSNPLVLGFASNTFSHFWIGGKNKTRCDRHFFSRGESAYAIRSSYLLGTFSPGERIREGKVVSVRVSILVLLLPTGEGRNNCHISHSLPPEVDSGRKALIIECQLFLPAAPPRKIWIKSFISTMQIMRIIC